MDIKTIKNYNKFTEINPSSNNESKLYKSNDELIKIIYDSFLDENRKQNILLLENIKHPNCVTPNYAVSKNGKDINGYAMDYLEGYINLSKYNNKKLSFRERKKIAHKICQILNDLKEYEFSYIDVHSDNFMIKNNDIQLVDMDSGKFKSLCKDDSYNFRCEYVTNYISELCYQILLGTNIDLKNEINYYAKVRLINKSSTKQKEFLNHVFDNAFGYFDTEEYIDLFNETTIEDTKKILNIKRNK